ncbi:MAG: HEAT repeat domain-containing protein [Myxococcales bacterium]|nr:HEAT repeat domain-containing protein [Myxococcales bacterium]
MSRHIPVVIVVAALAVAIPHSADARLHEGLNLSSTRGARVVAVVAIRAKKRAGPTTAGGRYPIEVRARVELSVKGSRRGRMITFRAFALVPQRGPQLNGYHFAPLPVGALRLVWLRDAGAGSNGLSLVAPEDPPPSFDRALLGKARALLARARGASDEARVARVLMLQLAACTQRCAKTAWLLADALRQRAAPRAAVVAQLKRIARVSRDGNTRLAAYTTLGRAGETSVIPEIVRFISGNKGRETTRSNAISWLQGFSNKRQRAALQQILKATRSKLVRSSAKYRLRYVK